MNILAAIKSFFTATPASFTAYAVLYEGPQNEHWTVYCHKDITGVTWDNPGHTGVMLVRANGGSHYSSPTIIRVTRDPATLPSLLIRP